MNLIKLAHQKIESYTEHEKILILLDMVKNYDLFIKQNEVDTLNIFKHILIHVFNQKKHETKLAKILVPLLLKMLSNSSICIKIMDMILSIKPQVNFFFFSKKYKINIAVAFFETVKKTANLKAIQKLAYYKKLLKWISQKTPITELSYLSSNNEKEEFLNHFVNREVKGYENIIYHIALNTQQYNIDLMINNNHFFRYLFWNYDDDKTVIKLRKKIIKNLPVSFFDQNFIFSKSDKENCSIFDFLCYFSEPSTVDYLFTERPELFNQFKLNPEAIIRNQKLSLDYKKELLSTFSNFKSEFKFIVLIACFKRCSVKLSQKDMIDFFNFCQEKFLITYTNLDKLLPTHSMCSLNYVAKYNLIEIEKFITFLGLTSHEKDGKDNFPLHYLASYSLDIKSDNIDEVIELVKTFKEKKINFNCTNKLKNTPLHLALKLNKPALFIQELLLAGARLNQKNKFGKTPYEYTKKYKYLSEIAPLIQSIYEKEKLEKIIENDNVLNLPKKQKI